MTVSYFPEDIRIPLNTNVGMITRVDSRRQMIITFNKATLADTQTLKCIEATHLKSPPDDPISLPTWTRFSVPQLPHKISAENFNWWIDDLYPKTYYEMILARGMAALWRNDVHARATDRGQKIIEETIRKTNHMSEVMYRKFGLTGAVASQIREQSAVMGRMWLKGKDKEIDFPIVVSSLIYRQNTDSPLEDDNTDTVKYDSQAKRTGKPVKRCCTCGIGLRRRRTKPANEKRHNGSSGVGSSGLSWEEKEEIVNRQNQNVSKCVIASREGQISYASRTCTIEKLYNLF
ncbi:hypothetical protein IAR55_000022 [Kwoniella newhampshirensis]|uniref:Uncharacterized protein n=1 Tax=Kwoniella newhampshirensis TaxID=1651941 RepID=A0AAW0Z5K1_9TREE